ncbi:PREDICTED: gamma-glutamyl hydrolase 1-like [Nicotiana attenuata]|uniref:folate gamma-glutamyl hydrolase n=1 Tax=Nicotiana attenuata TaxID=49451 RepID=A0A314KUV4_NICAT|nr:PREDICTED: gamma-glutamyl hydrolase 1-like [Nicotiana attenuata]OIT33052.1 gamma-glutamyl hydrolase 1 [Nicotiana attenuata]
MSNYFLISVLTISLFVAVVATAIESSSELSVPAGCPVPDPRLNYRPVIGIISHPGDGASGRIVNSTSVSFIAASYVKFVESAGARVIPLLFEDSPQLLNQKLDLVNGVIFPGGWARKGKYFETVKAIFKKVLEKNDADEHLPLLAINLGFELLMMIVSKDNNILEKFSVPNQASKLRFVETVNIEDTVFGRFPPTLLKKLSKECLVLQRNKYGLSPEKFQANDDLSSFFIMLTTSTDTRNKVFVSTLQAENYPITALQWHPEKSAFEWGSAAIPHSEDAVQVTQLVANYFVGEARKSSNKPDAQKVLDNLIYNYSPAYSGKAGKGYDEVYIFNGPALSSL